MPAIPDLTDPRYLDEVGWFLYHEKHRRGHFGGSYDAERLAYSRLLLEEVVSHLGVDVRWIEGRTIVSIGCGCTGDKRSNRRQHGRFTDHLQRNEPNGETDGRSAGDRYERGDSAEAARQQIRRDRQSHRDCHSRGEAEQHRSDGHGHDVCFPAKTTIDDC